MTDDSSDTYCATDGGAEGEDTSPSHQGEMVPDVGKHVLLFADPMCSWCWGFQPIMSALQDHIRSHDATLHLIMGGLRVGTTEPWDAKLRGYVRHHWTDVASTTGQSFDTSRFDDLGFVYNTEPACRAVVTVRTLAPELSYPYYVALQRAFYAEGRDITQGEVLAHLAEGLGLDQQDFLSHFNTPPIQVATAADFTKTLGFGVQGFPTVICSDDGQLGILCRGYAPLDRLESPLLEWLKG